MLAYVMPSRENASRVYASCADHVQPFAMEVRKANLQKQYDRNLRITRPSTHLRRFVQ